MPKLKNVRSFKPRHASVEELAQVLNALEINARVVPVPKAHLLVVSGDEDVLKEIADVVEALDVEDRGTSDKPPLDKRKGDISAPAEAKKFAFEFRNKPWGSMFDWLSDQTGLPVTITSKPTGTFSFISTQGRGKQYTLPEIIDILNEALSDQQYLLIRRSNSFLLVAPDTKIDPAIVPRIELQELGQRGKTELVSVVVPLKTIKADKIEPEITKLMGRFGNVMAFDRTNQLILQDTAGNLRRVLKTLEDAEKAQPAK